MDFGKLPSLQPLSRMSFLLPAIDQRSAELLTGSYGLGALPTEMGAGPRKLPNVFIGCPVWGNKRWLGQLYPPRTPQKDFLKFYSHHFNTIELNTTFYRIPEPSTVLQWCKNVPPSFKFSPKVFQGISTFEVLKEIPALTERLCQSLQNFGTHLGTSFLQLPPSFGPQKILILKRFFTLLPKDFQLAIEFRHPAWFEKGRLIDPAFELLAENRIGTVITDVAGRRDVLHSTLTTPMAMIRFVGNSLHPTDFTRIEGWVERLSEWFQQGVHTVYFFAHQPDEDGCLELIDHLIPRLNQKCHLQLKSWDRDLAMPQPDLFGRLG